jgi:hypothetical protein
MALSALAAYWVQPLANNWCKNVRFAAGSCHRSRAPGDVPVADNEPATTWEGQRQHRGFGTCTAWKKCNDTYFSKVITNQNQVLLFGPLSPSRLRVSDQVLQGLQSGRALTPRGHPIQVAADPPPIALCGRPRLLPAARDLAGTLWSHPALAFGRRHPAKPIRLHLVRGAKLPPESRLEPGVSFLR